MTNIQITEQYKQLLDLISNDEAKNGSYDSLYPSKIDSRISTSTIQWILDFQDRVAPNNDGPAAGRYQFINPTLKRTAKNAGIDIRTVVFSSRVQDYLAVKLIETDANGSAWLAGNIPDIDFVFNLSKVWAGVRVPFDTKGRYQNVVKGQSFYARQGGPNNPQILADRADNFVRKVASIRTGIPPDRVAHEVDLESSQYRAENPQGSSAEDQWQGVAAGGADYHRTGKQILTDLPPSAEVYQYDVIDAFDDRYDFRTGRKVRDLLVNGTTSLRNSSIDTTSPLNSEPGTFPQPGSKGAEPVGEEKDFPVVGDEITTKMNEILSDRGAAAIVGESLNLEDIEILKNNGYVPSNDVDFIVPEISKNLYPAPVPDETENQYRDRLRKKVNDPNLQLGPAIIKKYFSNSNEVTLQSPVTSATPVSRPQELGLSSTKEKALPETPTLPSSAIRSTRRSFLKGQ